jgi:hypothetical protein
MWAGFLGGSDFDHANSLMVDERGRVYLAGWTRSRNFPITPRALFRQFREGVEEDAFVAVVSPTGDSLVYATYVGGIKEDWICDMALDHSGNVVVAVLTNSPDLPTTADAFDRTFNGSREAYIAKMDLWNQRLLWATYLGSTNQDWPQALTVDTDGRIHMVGVTFSEDFPVTEGAIDSVHRGFSDLFVATLDSSGSALLYATLLGGTDQERSTDLSIDDDHNIYITGWTRSADFPTTPTASDTVLDGQADGLVIALNPHQNGLLYSSFVGGDGIDVIYGLAVDGRGRLFVAGSTNSIDFPITPGAPFDALIGEQDAFVAGFELDLQELSHP